MAMEEYLRSERRADAAFAWAGLLVRAVGYSLLAAAATVLEPVRVLLAGLLFGDLAGHLLALALDCRRQLLARGLEFLLVLLITVWSGAGAVWSAAVELRPVLWLGLALSLYGSVGPWLRDLLPPLHRGLH